MKAALSFYVAVAFVVPAMLAAPPESSAPQQPAARQFRLIFNGYDGDGKKPDSLTFQINNLDWRQPSEFLRLGEMVPNTKLKLTKFEFKEIRNPRTGEPVDVSELTVTNTETGKSTVLVLTKVTALDG